MADRVVVQVPATIANLGPGFDCMGLALAWHNEVRIERADALSISASGRGAEDIPKDETNLMLRAMAALLGEVPRVRLHQLIAIPGSAGFGSSATAVVGGLLAARALEETDHTTKDLLRMAVEIEGHADNVTPCLLGGITITSGERTIRLDPSNNIRPLVCLAPGRLSTEAARAALPETVSRSDAVANLSRAALLAAALATGNTDALFEATDDSFHQPVRFGLMPDSGALARALRDKGIAAFLSGAGPGVAALVPTDTAQETEALARGLAPESWEVRLESFDATGAQIADSR